MKPESGSFARETTGSQDLIVGCFADVIFQSPIWAAFAVCALLIVGYVGRLAAVLKQLNRYLKNRPRNLTAIGQLRTARRSQATCGSDPQMCQTWPFQNPLGNSRLSAVN
jgi:hypothetical protein